MSWSSRSAIRAVEIRYSRPAARFSARRLDSAIALSRSMSQPRHGASEASGDELEYDALVVRRRGTAVGREHERADVAEAVLDVDLHPVAGGRPRGIARGGAEALARVERQDGGAHAELLADARHQALEHLVRGQRVDRRIEHGPEAGEHQLRAAGFRADRSSALHCRAE